MLKTILFLALGVVCLGLSAQSYEAQSYEVNGKHYLRWDIPVADLPTNPVPSLLLTHHAPIGNQITDFEGPETVVDSLWGDSLDHGWTLNHTISPDHLQVMFELGKVDSPIVSTDYGGGIVIVIEDGISSYAWSETLTLLSNPSSSLSLDYQSTDPVPATLVVGNLHTGVQVSYQISPGVNHLPTANLPPGYYFLSVPSKPAIQGVIWHKW